MPANSASRLTVIFSGHVQGVGFRYRTRQTAESFSVTGYVQNLADGTVRMVVEGSMNELEDFLQAVQSRMEGNIRETNVVRSIAVGEFDGFQIQ